MTDTKTPSPSDAEIETLAVEYEAFGFGRVDDKGLTTHGFDPDGLGNFVRAILDRWGAQPAGEPTATDTARLDYMQAHPEKFIRYHKGKWAFLGFTNYEFDMHPTLREAIDASARE